ncbi:hypothetical protein QN277_028329 [Acacia crassicarpa]|uniref:Uncharacterized protein n=1 Tax=Acacia crassicarpa TaxID=499986 RepID=A0AAE1MI62_9FABA|nr:hypothetical protein QN277_028329 [Acacia crassicarpa]
MPARKKPKQKIPPQQDRSGKGGEEDSESQQKTLPLKNKNKNKKDLPLCRRKPPPGRRKTPARKKPKHKIPPQQDRSGKGGEEDHRHRTGKAKGRRRSWSGGEDGDQRRTDAGEDTRSPNYVPVPN